MAGPTTQIVVMGVSGTGKTTVARRLAAQLRLPFVDGDDLHPRSNVDKMAAGVPLTDADRRPWLLALRDLIAGAQAGGRSSVVACSALRRSYRDTLRSRVPPGSVLFLHLDAPSDVLQGRLAGREHHFMTGSLLRSQLETLEPLEPDEPGARLDATARLDAVVAEAVGVVRSAQPASP